MCKKIKHSASGESTIDRHGERSWRIRYFDSHVAMLRLQNKNVGVIDPEPPVRISERTPKKQKKSSVFSPPVLMLGEMTRGCLVLTNGLQVNAEVELSRSHVPKGLRAGKSGKAQGSATA